MAYILFNVFFQEVKAQDQAPVSPISKERLIDHQDKCKLAMEEVSPAAKAINSFTNEFIKKLKEISTLNWSSFNIGSYYDKTKASIRCMISQSKREKLKIIVTDFVICITGTVIITFMLK